jgi:NDP-sugar pyrophosphorylase family protein
MAVTDIKEKANEVREERASSLKGFFNSCFVPTKSNEEKISNIKDNSIDNTKYSENAIHSEGNIYSANTTHTKNTMHSGNEIYIGNDTRSESTTLENGTRSESTTLGNDTRSGSTTYSGTSVKLAKCMGFTALGVLAVLIDEFPAGSGMLNVTQLSKACGVARTTLITQLRSLEKCGAVSLGDAEKNGRWLEILCSENTTCSENDTLFLCSSSSIYNNKNNYYYKDPITNIENATYSENDTLVADARIENTTYIGNDIYSENTMCIENAICSENNTLNEKLSKSKITVRIAARELFFIAKASRVNIDRLSKQCFEQFLTVKHTKGANYAMALFLSLLSKSKENPTAYVIRAIQQGATPSREDQRKAEIISKAGETVFKKIGEEILQRDLDFALSQIVLEGVSQNQVQEELDIFTERISE